MQRQTRKTKAPWAVLLALFLLATAVFPTAGGRARSRTPPLRKRSPIWTTVSVSPDADLEEGNVEILYYFYNRCLSCDEEATIEENILGMLKKDFPNVTADLTIKNVAEEENLEALRQALIDSGGWGRKTDAASDRVHRRPGADRLAGAGGKVPTGGGGVSGGTARC